MDRQRYISELLENFPFTDFSFTTLDKPKTIEAYKNWLNNNFNGEMGYMKDHLPLKEYPKNLLDKSKSAIVILKNYFPQPHKSSLEIHNLRIAEYAKNDDYHFWFQNQLNKIVEELQHEFPGETFMAMTDSKPVLERDLAQKAGLGWFGKNTCLINQKHGSLFFIGEIYTSLELNTAKAIHPDRCGTCTRCIDACPTDALVKPYVLDANKCISYLTIEKKGSIDESLRPKMHDWFFGCDICQTVCPWNEKVFGMEMKYRQDDKLPVTPKLIEELRFILTTSGKKLLKEFNGSPLIRARASGLKRNAITVIANQKITELKPEVEACLKQESLTETAGWCLTQL